MKTFVRIALLVMLVAAIVFGTAWYLLEYDTDFTHDALLYGAQFFEEKGQPAISTLLYNMAYQYGQSIDQIALELAEHYQSVGNYAKVEATLKRAINDGAGVDVYIALSRAFVEQDKLWDALQLVENVQDDAIRSKLEYLRPVAPAPNFPGGHYNEYISVNFQSDGSNVYVGNAQVPSFQTGLHSTPIALDTGETVLFSMAVGENGLVSPLTEHRYVVIGVVEPVVFTDEKMEEAIRDLVSIPYGVTVYTNDLWNIRSFEVPKNVSDYSDLKYLTFLESLTIPKGNASLVPVQSLEHLTALSIQDAVMDSETLQVILSRTNITSLTLRNCALTSLSGFEALTNLTNLDVSENILTDLTPLSNLTALENLSISNSAVVDLTALQSLPALQELDLSFNSISDVSPLSALPGLKKLNLSNNQVSNIRPIGKLTKLTGLDLSHNKISTVSYLSTCVALQELVISNNTISNISSFSSLVDLEELDVSNNVITKLPSLPDNCSLSTFVASYNKITNLTPLAGLENLNTVNLDYNPRLSNITPLSECMKLVSLSAYGTSVKDATALTDLGIAVYYNPISLQTP
ncbi:MAG: hypothetical protein E7435_05245 [Ruminococcaceae bacterium]|nr:hypothetical protein [Oscillospiraceae bacterium]